MRLTKLSCYLVALLIANISGAQDNLPSVDKAINLPNKFIEKIEKKTSSIEDQLISKTEKYLKKLARQEQKIYKKLKKVDSVAAGNLFSGSQEKYTALIQKLIDPIAGNGNNSGEYFPYIDSIKGSLTFLNENKSLVNTSKEFERNVTNSLGQFKQLQSRLKQSDEIKQFIKERKEQIRQTFSRYRTLPAGLKREFSEFNKEIYYYSQQVKEYRELLNDPDKLTLKALSLLNKVPAFSKFFAEHSELSGLFSVPDSYASAQSLKGLQTTEQIQKVIRGRIGTGPGAMTALQENLQAAQAQLNKFKDKINQLGGGSGEIDMPDFKPVNEKTKTFWKRLEYGTNLQNTRSNYFFPNSTDLGLSVGYKLSEKSIVGLGMSYRIGWGKDLSHFEVSSEGIGLRSFIDLKIKSSFFASGGFEYNYQQPFNSVDQIRSLNNWQQSGLAGVTKIVSLKSKVFKKTKVQLLWDFLSYYQRPVAQPIRFRIGYNF